MHDLFIVEIGKSREIGQELLQEHLNFLRTLYDSGTLLMAGPYLENDDGPASGLYVIAAETARHATALAEGDPLVKAGATFTVRMWRRTF